MKDTAVLTSNICIQVDKFDLHDKLNLKIDPSNCFYLWHYL